jgi:predicted RNA-binding Zn-ribbon protein involved in translation (DUF1610 family)
MAKGQLHIINEPHALGAWIKHRSYVRASKRHCTSCKQKLESLTLAINNATVYPECGHLHGTAKKTLYRCPNCFKFHIAGNKGNKYKYFLSSEGWY